MRIGLVFSLLTLLGGSLTGGAWARAADSRPQDFVAVDHNRRSIYHAPQKPGYTCWVYAWVMPDDSIMVTFYQAVGPTDGRPRAPESIQKKLSWPHLADPRRDMTGLKSSNVFLRSKDGGLTWEKVSEDFFRTPINGAVNGAVGLRDGSILRPCSVPTLLTSQMFKRPGCCSAPPTEQRPGINRPASSRPTTIRFGRQGFAR